ncbi:MAG: hypothetical protein KIT35_14630 [Piscinibacter sp.]|uniref:hypothetical protein n=1 Tax=Piscinibacter TaxID=1114981 RepID=UPI0013E3F749|nr:MULTISPECIES: hypothetical protein [Piscinibacter]MCW5665062.1 hypothetical protein [Piscinibacter sp.]
MPPRTLPNTPRVVTRIAPKAPVLKPTDASRPSKVLQTGRAPEQLSLFLRPSGAR